METTLTLCLEGTDKEIEIPITFNATPGEPATHWEPAEPAEVEIISWDKEAVIASVEKLLESQEVEEWCLNEAEEAGPEWEAERAEFRFNERGVA